MELLLLVAEWLSEPARCALASTSRQLQATTSALFVGHASLRTSVLFRRPFTANVHYRADVARIAELLHQYLGENLLLPAEAEKLEQDGHCLSPCVDAPLRHC